LSAARWSARSTSSCGNERGGPGRALVANGWTLSD
jgi:hypothetical protein